MNSLTLIGLVRYRKNPACRPFSMSRGIALALRAIHGDVRGGRVFAQDFQGFDAADAGQIDVHQDHVRPVRAGQLISPDSILSGAQQADIRTARDQLLDQFQIRRVVLHVEQGATRRAMLNFA
jgi:hypothetical protein